MGLTCSNGCDAGWHYQSEAIICRAVSIYEDGSVFVAPNPPYDVEEIPEIEAKFVCNECNHGVPAMEGSFEWA
jgi:hypothetical protein